MTTVFPSMIEHKDLVKFTLYGDVNSNLPGSAQRYNSSTNSETIKTPEGFFDWLSESKYKSSTIKAQIQEEPPLYAYSLELDYLEFRELINECKPLKNNHDLMEKISSWEKKISDNNWGKEKNLTVHLDFLKIPQKTN